MSKALRCTLAGFMVQSLSVLEPRIDRFPVDPSSAPLRWGDPVKQIAGGTIVRALPTDTALLGIAASGNQNILPLSIAQPPFLTDSAGRTLASVYLADALTVFTAQTIAAPTQANVLQTHDFQYAIPDALAPTPAVSNVGAAGATTYNYTLGALTENGETLPGPAGSTATGNAVLSKVNYNQLVIPQTARAASYNIYRNGALIGTAAANTTGTTTFNDVGQAVQNGLPATINMTGWVVNNTAQSTNVLQVRSIDTKPIQPFINTFNVGAVLFSIAAAKSQVQNVAGA